MTRINKLHLHGFKSFAKPTTLEFVNGFNCVIGSNGSGKSCRYDTLVLLGDGSQAKIGELVETNLKKAQLRMKMSDGEFTVENDERLEVFALDPESMRVVKKRISAFIKREGEKELYEIKTVTGKKVVTTGCHPVMVFRNGKIVSAMARDLKESDRIATPRELNIPGKSVKLPKTDSVIEEEHYYKIQEKKALVTLPKIPTLELCRLLGYIVGDGYIGQKRIDIVNGEEEILNDIESILSMFRIPVTKSKIKNSVASRIFGRARKTTEWLVKLFEDRVIKEKKHIPSEIMNAPKECLAAFLSALFDCDATVSKTTPAIEYTTMSEELANQVHIALLRFGIVARKVEKVRWATNTTAKKRRTYYDICLEGKKPLEKYYQQIGFVSKKKRERVFAHINKSIKANPNLDLLPEEVNVLTRMCVKALALPVKPLGKKHPRLLAYWQRVCSPSREGLEVMLELFDRKMKELLEVKEDLKSFSPLNQRVLCNSRKVIGVSAASAARSIGVAANTMTRSWQEGVFTARPQNLKRFYDFCINEVVARLATAYQLIKILEKLAYSDIFWDEITQIRLVKGEPYVYDLTIPDCHNFIGNGIFVHNSNIMDALCFVLGKISAKSMRAEKSANLIFNGGKKSSPMKEAEVSIYFDNSTKEFPNEKKEVKVSRIVRQQGTSVYKIDDETRTREQVLELLSKAKIDPDGHNIVLQGDIVHFMEMHTEERREVIEEIAGISVYEDRKQKALNELEKVEQRLNEVTIILNEREAYLKELKKERDQAMKYRELESNIKSNNATFLHRQLSERQTKVAEIDQRIKKVQEETDKISSKITELQKQIEEHKQTIQKINKEIEEKGEVESVKVQKDLEKLRGESIKINERSAVCKQEIEKVKERKKQLQHSIGEVDTNIASLSKNREALEKSLKDLQTRKTQVEESLQRSRSKVNLGSSKELEQLEKQLESNLLSIKELTVQKEDLMRKRFEIESQMRSFEDRMQMVKAALKGLDIEKADEELSSIKKDMLKFGEEESVLSRQVKSQREELLKKNEELFRLKAKMSGAAAAINIDRAVDRITKLNNKKVYGTIASLMTTDSKYALALEVAAGTRLKAIVVEDDKTAAECIQLLKDERLGVASFLPLNKIKPGTRVSAEGKGVFGSCLDLIHFDKQYKDAFAYVFANTLVVENIDIARRLGIGRYRMVTLEGDIMETSGAMIGGHRTRSFQVREIGKDTDIKALENAIVSLSKLTEVAEKRRSEIQQTMEKISLRRAELEARLFKAERTAGMNMQEVRERIAKLKEHPVFTQGEALEAKIREREKLNEELKKERDKIKSQVRTLGSEDAVSLERLEKSKEKIVADESMVETQIKNIDLQVKNIYSPEKEKLLQVMKQHEKEEQHFIREFEELTKRLNEITTLVKQQEKVEEGFYKEYRALFDKRQEIEQRVQKSENQVKQEEQKQKECWDRTNSINIQRAKIAAELEAINKEYDEFRGVELRTHISDEKLKEEIRDFEKMLKEMGNVNLRALEIYEDIRKEYESLLEKVDKLRVEKEDVLAMMYEIESRKKEMFMKIYEVIAKNFTSIFSNLSTKGEALLELENPEDPLSAGVEIKVRIAGNKFLDIKSLSGGEKTLAALSFIFAIQEHQPAAFYLMDEVDAALDKNNSALLSKLIGKYSQHAQYILISHNDAVITEAQTIYGISMMQESGTSKVVSLKFEDEQKSETEKVAPKIA